MRHGLVSFVLLLGLPLNGAIAGSPVEIIAHRGASHIAPENTLAAVELGWRKGADAVEIDIRLTGDGRIVLSHDGTTERTAPGTELVVGETSLERLRELDVGRWKGERWAGERMPTLGQVLRTVPEGKRLFIEIKGGPEIVPELARVLNGSEKEPEQLVVIGFNERTVERAKEALPELEVYLLSGLSRNEETGRWEPSTEELIERAERIDADGLNLRAVPALDAGMVRAIKEHGLGVYAWTVNSPRVARRLTQAGIDGITTDRPGWLRERLEGDADQAARGAAPAQGAAGE